MKKLVIGCLGAVALTGVLLVVLFLFWVFHDLPVLDASLTVPTTMSLDSSATMVVNTSNPHSEAITLDSIDIDESFLAGFQVVSVRPQPTDTMRIFGQRSWSFGQSVAPGSSLAVEFELKAVQEGHFTGDIDVCNPNQDFTTLMGDVVIRSE